jgi:hypothetical protein
MNVQAPRSLCFRVAKPVAKPACMATGLGTLCPQILLPVDRYTSLSRFTVPLLMLLANVLQLLLQGDYKDW